MLKIDKQGFLLNGERVPKLWGRSSFKLSNILTYHYTGQGGGPYSLGAARRWVDYNQQLFGEHVVLRVFLETGGWEGKVEIFGSPPSDQGFWNRDALRNQSRSGVEMTGRGKKILEWFFQTSQETGAVFELVIDATLKHDARGYTKGQVDHAIRAVGQEMGRLSDTYPQALIIPNCRNEWNAHNKTGHSLADVNMWATRWERDQYWPGSQPIVDGGGGNMFDYAVGGPGKFAMGLVHPDRGSGWENLVPSVVNNLRAVSRGQPVGFNESMYYVEPEDRARAEQWYRAGGWTTDWAKFRKFTEAALEHCDYHIIHDEKGVQCDPEWPRAQTRLEAHFGPSGPPPPPLPDPPTSGPWELRVNKPAVTKIVHPPVVVQEGEENVYRASYTFPRKGFLREVWVFHGRDRGDIAEMDTNVYVNGVIPAALRSDHHETYGSFDAWTHYIVDQAADEVNIDVLGRVNGPSERTGDLTIRPHWGIYLVWLPEIGEEDPPPTDEDDSIGPTWYIPLGDAEWKARLENAYTEWRGHRDLMPLVGRPEWISAVGLTAGELQEIISDMEETQEVSRRLQYRIDNEPNPDWEGRSRVRKARAREHIEVLEEMTSIYDSIARKLPEVAGCDSIRCKLKKL